MSKVLRENVLAHLTWAESQHHGKGKVGPGEAETDGKAFLGSLSTNE